MVQITPQASQDIAKLAQGVDRAQVALEALKDSLLTPAQVKQLEALLKTVSPTEGAASATTSPAVSEIKRVDGHPAVVGKVTVNGQQLDTLLSEGSFNRSRPDQHKYAAKLGYRMATRAENQAYVDSLLAKEEDKSINAAEANALETYRNRYVRDDEGGLDVDGRRVRDAAPYHYHWRDCDDPCDGALFVHASTKLPESLKPAAREFCDFLDRGSSVIFWIRGWRSGRPKLLGNNFLACVRRLVEKLGDSHQA